MKITAKDRKFLVKVFRLRNRLVNIQNHALDMENRHAGKTVEGYINDAVDSLSALLESFPNELETP